MASPRLNYVLLKNLRREITKAHCSKSELARRCGWPPSRISELLSGRFEPRIGTLEKLCEVLEVQPASLLTPFVRR